LASAVLLAAAWGSAGVGEASAPSSTPATSAPPDTAGAAPETTAGTSATAGSAEQEGILLPAQPDTNGDGKVVVGLLVGGDANDGGFYESVKTIGQDFADQEGWDFILVDNVQPADYVQEMTNLARQDVDMLVAIGGVSPFDAMTQVSADSEFDGKAFVMLAGTAAEIPNEHFITVRDDAFEVNYITGVAAALVMERDSATKAGFVSGPEVDFSVAARAAFEAGLKSQIPDAEVVATYTGDMDNAGLAVEAVRAQLNNGVQLVYPYLGGASDAVSTEANTAGVPVFSTAVNRCDDPDIDFAGASLFSKAPYLLPILESFRDGEFRTGYVRTFHVGIDPEPGAALCEASADEQKVLDDVAQRIGSGAIDPQAEAQQYM
jgi:basic membrane protein A